MINLGLGKLMKKVQAN